MPGMSWTFSGSWIEETGIAKKGPYDAHIDLGSNLGDGVAMVEQACRDVEARSIRIVKASNIYETEPIYIKYQNTSLNGVCKVETFLDPIELLDTL